MPISLFNSRCLSSNSSSSFKSFAIWFSCSDKLSFSSCSVLADGSLSSSDSLGFFPSPSSFSYSSFEAGHKAEPIYEVFSLMAQGIHPTLNPPHIFLTAQYGKSPRLKVLQDRYHRLLGNLHFIKHLVISCFRLRASEAIERHDLLEPHLIVLQNCIIGGTDNFLCFIDKVPHRDFLNFCSFPLPVHCIGRISLERQDLDGKFRTERVAPPVPCYPSPKPCKLVHRQPLEA